MSAARINMVILPWQRGLSLKKAGTENEKDAIKIV
jgi:hypothetical protein